MHISHAPASFSHERRLAANSCSLLCVPPGRQLQLSPVILLFLVCVATSYSLPSTICWSLPRPSRHPSSMSYSGKSMTSWPTYRLVSKSVPCRLDSNYQLIHCDGETPKEWTIEWIPTPPSSSHEEWDRVFGQTQCHFMIIIEFKRFQYCNLLVIKLC
jgi:hypothetical protein